MKDHRDKRGNSQSRRPRAKLLKYFSSRTDRRATKDALRNGQFDKIPDGKRVKEVDPYDYD